MRVPPFRPRLLLLGPVALYLLCLALPAMDMTTLDSGREVSETADLRGFAVLLVGWLMIPSGNPAWLANPLFGYLLFRLFRGGGRSRMMLLLTAIMVVCAAIPTLLALEAGPPTRSSLHAGYWVWLASISLTAVVMMTWWWQNQRSTKEIQP